MSDRAYLSPKDVAGQTGLSSKTIRRAYEAGELVAYKVRGRVLIRPQDVDAWIESQRIRPAALAPTSPRRPSPVSEGLRRLLDEAAA